MRRPDMRRLISLAMRLEFVRREIERLSAAYAETVAVSQRTSYEGAWWLAPEHLAPQPAFEAWEASVKRQGRILEAMASRGRT